MVLFIPTLYFQMFSKSTTVTASTWVMTHVCFEIENAQSYQFCQSWGTKDSKNESVVIYQVHK